MRDKNSANFKNRKFQNLSHTPQLTEGYTFLKVIKENLLSSWPDKIPLRVLPSIKTNLIELPKDEDVLVWFGHSSYFIQADGKRFLIDPVFSGHASPFPGMINAFKGSDIYTVDDLPNIDYLFITHDHLRSPGLQNYNQAQAESEHRDLRIRSGCSFNKMEISRFVNYRE